MKILVTGATGYIGSKLTKKLVSLGYDTGILIRSKSDTALLKDVIPKIKVFIIESNYASINSAVAEFKPDLTVHLASLFIDQHTPEAISNLCESNILFGMLLLETLVNNDCKLFINTGTSWQHYNDEIYNPANLYAATKQAFDDIIKYYIEAYALRCITLKLFDTYGPDDTRPKIFNLLNKIAETEEQIEMSAGGQEFNIVHIDDVIQAYLYCIEELQQTNACSKIYGVGNEHSKTLREYVNDYEIYLKKRLNIIWGGRPYKRREVMTSWKAFNKIKKLFINPDIFKIEK
ncbi:MAG TPA: NAD(P)-dependent oxidoreductase [Mucilaginibacter sp.]|jgi:nucleoside-diphosphate-sugar epimerase|nr:NAD(P)-dependent oxidoreductase [Mucilaginibacter sp.]